MKPYNSFVLGTNIYSATGEAMERMDTALESWRQLDVPLRDLAFTDCITTPVAGFIQKHTLHRDSCSVTGTTGRRKPLVRDLFDGLWVAARESKCDYFVFSNADIILTPNFRDTVRQLNADSAYFTRFDLINTPSDSTSSLYVRGQDTYAVRTEWWGENRHRFRPYILGEPQWDNIYTTLFARHGHSMLFYDVTLCHHKVHAQHWQAATPFGRYNNDLRRRFDDMPFSMWVRYSAEICSLDVSAVDFREHQRKLWHQLAVGRPSLKAAAKNLFNKCRTLAAGVPPA
jgi:hypothetical protein